jgi:hypothetical protein
MMVNILVRRLSLAPDWVDRRSPRRVVTIRLPSHSKCMRFRGQRHGLVIQLLWSPLAPGTFPRRRPYQSFMGWEIGILYLYS